MLTNARENKDKPLSSIQFAPGTIFGVSFKYLFPTNGTIYIYTHCT